MAPALPAGLIGREAAACVLLGAVLGGARALFPEKGRGAFLPDVLLVGALLLGLQSYAASLSFGGVLRWYQLGGLGNYMNTSELQAGRGEPLKDTARVLGRYYDCVVWRTYRQRDLEEFAEQAGVPVINGLTDYAHPCQVLADLMTIRERRGTLAGRKLCFVGDGGSMANSLIVGGLLAGMQVTCVCPEAYRPAADVLMLAHKYGSQFHFTSDPVEGVRDADVVATAVWNTAAPGTAESEQRLRDFVGFQLTGKLLEAAKPDAMVLHCLPAHRGEEISTAVFEQHADEIFDEAENRLHVQKAVLAILLAGK